MLDALRESLARWTWQEADSPGPDRLHDAGQQIGLAAAAAPLDRDQLEFTLAVADQMAKHLMSIRDRERLQRGKFRVESQNVELRQQLEAETALIGNSPALQAVRRAVARVAPTDATVLIRGESGVGKDLVARAIVAASRRPDQPFVKVNCAALPAELLESELFGHERGAFTGAYQRKPGRFEVARHGTLFLDEIGELPLALQTRLLRALDKKQIRRLGAAASATIDVDVRVIAATHRNLDREVEDGRFRLDPYHRLAVFPIRVPPLRERASDVEMLARHFVRALGGDETILTRDVLARLAAHRWPGNVRELRNTVERLLILARGAEVAANDVERLVAGAEAAAGLTAELLAAPRFADFKERAERAFLLGKLREHDWNVSETARSVEMPRSNLYKKIERYGLVREAS